MAKASSRQQRKDAISSTGASGTQHIVQPAAGYTKSPAISDDGVAVNADYYRDGRFSKTDAGSENDYPAKSLTLFDTPSASGKNLPASIRVYGTGSGAKRQAVKDNGRFVGFKERDFIPAYTKFILEGSQEGYQERHQVIETFSDFYVFFYGQRPSIFTFNGTLINSKNINWVADFTFYYENFLRGTKCAENNARIILTYGGRQIEGYMLACNTQTNATTEAGVPMSFQFLLTRKNNVGYSDDFATAIANGTTVEDTDLKALLDAVAGKQGTGTSDKGTSNAFGAVRDAVGGGGPAARLLPP